MKACSALKKAIGEEDFAEHLEELLAEHNEALVEQHLAEQAAHSDEEDD